MDKYILADTCVERKFWDKDLNHCSFLSKQKIELEGKLLKYGSLLKRPTLRTYYLTHEAIFYSKKGDGLSNCKGFRHLHEVVLAPSIKKCCYLGFSLKQNKCLIELFAQTNEEFIKWMTKLREKCIQTDFCENFNVLFIVERNQFANLYKVQKKNDGNLFIAKKIPKIILESEHKSQSNLLNEIHIMRNICHYRIVKLFNIYEDDQAIYLIKQNTYCTLKYKLLQHSNLKRYEIKVLMANLLEIISYLNSMRVMHRGLNPESVFIREKNSPIYEILIGEFQFATKYLEDITKTEMVKRKCGIVGYIAPEILNYSSNDKFYDQKCDIFSLGVIFHYLF